MAESTEIGVELVRRHIGRRFRALREQAHMSVGQARQEIDISRNTLDRLEAATPPGVILRESLIRHMLDVYQASDHDRAVLLALTAETRTAKNKTGSWWHNYTNTALPPWFTLFVTLEDGAETICLYQAELIPGLLQTRGYITRIMSVPEGRLEPAEIQRRVEVRLERQSLLTRARAPKVEVVLTDAAINRLVGMGAELAREQLQHLLDVTQRGNVTLCVLPSSAGAHGGMAAGGGFDLLHFPTDTYGSEPIEPPLAYIESLTGAMYLAEPEEITEYVRVWDDVLRRACDPETSRKMIISTMEGLPQ